MFIALFTIGKGWKQSKCSSTEKWINKLWYIQTLEYFKYLIEYLKRNSKEIFNYDIFELLDKYNVSSVTWNISNKDETSAIFKPSCTKNSGFTNDDLSDSGKWVLNNLGGALD